MPINHKPKVINKKTLTSDLLENKETVNINIKLPRDVHLNLRRFALENQMSIKDAVVMLIDKYLKVPT